MSQSGLVWSGLVGSGLVWSSQVLVKSGQVWSGLGPGPNPGPGPGPALSTALRSGGVEFSLAWSVGNNLHRNLSAPFSNHQAQH